MNQLAIIQKHLRGIEKAYGEIKKPETKARAVVIFDEFWERVGLEEVPAALGGVSVGGADQCLAGSPEVFKGGSEPQDRPFVDQGERGPGVTLEELQVTVTSQAGVTTVYPADYKPEVEGDVGGTGTFYPETITAGPLVEEVGGWPVRARIRVTGLAPNRRMIKGTIGDDRVVSVERSFGHEWTPGEMISGRLVRAGAAPLYRLMK